MDRNDPKTISVVRLTSAVKRQAARQHQEALVTPTKVANLAAVIVVSVMVQGLARPLLRPIDNFS
jgi:hypothetical protein